MELVEGGGGGWGLITFIFSVKICYSVHDLFGHVDTLLFSNVFFI